MSIVKEIHRPLADAGLPSTRVAAHVPNDTIRTQSRRYGLFSPASCYGNRLIAPFADSPPAE